MERKSRKKEKNGDGEEKTHHVLDEEDMEVEVAFNMSMNDVCYFMSSGNS